MGLQIGDGSRSGDLAVFERCLSQETPQALSGRNQCPGPSKTIAASRDQFASIRLGGNKSNAFANRSDRRPSIMRFGLKLQR